MDTITRSDERLSGVTSPGNGLDARQQGVEAIADLDAVEQGRKQPESGVSLTVVAAARMGEVSWLLPEGDFVYWRGEVTAARRK